MQEGYKEKELKNRLLYDKTSYSLTIKSSGEVNPCVYWPLCLGNINESSIYDIWNSKITKSVQSLKRDIIVQCNECDMNSLCVFCPGTAFLENNSIDKCYSSAACLAKIRKKKYLT